MTPRDWYQTEGQAGEAQMRNVVRNMVVGTELPQLFTPKSIPGRAVDFDAAIAGSIPTAALADGSVTSAKILDGTIATADLADQAVTSAKIADLTIATGDLADSSVTPAKTGVVPGARVYNNANFTHNSTGNWLAVTFNSERFDTEAIHDTGSNTSRLTCVTAGIYQISGTLTHDTTASDVGIAIRLNGSTYIAIDTRPGNSGQYTLSISTVYSLSATNYVELMAYQASGGNLTFFALGNYSPEFGMVWVGKAA